MNFKKLEVLMIQTDEFEKEFSKINKTWSLNYLLYEFKLNNKILTIKTLNQLIKNSKENYKKNKEEHYLRGIHQFNFFKEILKNNNISALCLCTKGV